MISTSSTSSAPSTGRILLVSAAAERRQLWSWLVSQQYPQLACLLAHDGASALYQGTQRPLLSAVIDADLPDMNGDLITAGLRELQPALTILTVDQAECAPCLSVGQCHCDSALDAERASMTEILTRLFSCTCFGRPHINGPLNGLSLRMPGDLLS